MAKISQYYNLEYFSRGSYYSANVDKRRFLTLDYNLESYIGIVGNGIINGWTISQKSGPTIEILPGNGLINGFSAESPYLIIRRSQMDLGQREIEIIRFDEFPEPNLNDEHKNYYKDIIQAYDPSYIPPALIEDCFVKVVIPQELTLPNNQNCYIYAQLPTGHLPYPSLTDSSYTSFGVIQEPKISSYPIYSDYVIAKSEYDLNISNYREYQWSLYTENHFTAVEFSVSTSPSSDVNKVLLGAIKTRNNDIHSIDYKNVNVIKNLESGIKKTAQNLLFKHKHGGVKEYDPVKVKLDTDYRQCLLTNYSPFTQLGTYKILDKNRTSTEKDHNHSFIIDANGNGQTIETFGEIKSHFHKITSYELENIDEHSHTIKNNADYIDGWTIDSDYAIHLNGVIVGDQDSENFNLNFENKTIDLFNGTGIRYQTYFVDFIAYDSSYFFEQNCFSVYEFMMAMLADYSLKFNDEIIANPSASPITFPSTNSALLSLFPDETIGMEVLQIQSLTAEAALQKIGDSFEFRSPVANGVFVFLKTKSEKNIELKLEILNNTEVTGILPQENVTFIHASKFLSGEFAIKRIPFINHSGRIKEKFKSEEFGLISTNGYKFSVIPFLTRTTLGHYHNVNIDSDYSGNTEQTLINNKSILYSENNEYIYHKHDIEKSKIESSQNEFILKHEHSLKDVIPHSSKIIYAISEDSYGNIYLGSSDGMIMVPPSFVWKIKIEDKSYFSTKESLYLASLEISNWYQQESKKLIDFSNNYDEISDIEEELQTDSYGFILEVKQQNQKPFKVFIEKKSYANISTFSEEYKFQSEITENNTIKDLIFFNKDTNELINLDDENIEDYLINNLIGVKFLTEQEITSPIWNIELNERISNGKDDFHNLNNGSIRTEDFMITGCDWGGIGYDFQFNPNNKFKKVTTKILTKPLLKLTKDCFGNIWILGKNEIGLIKSGLIDTSPEIIFTQAYASEYFDIAITTTGVAVASSNGILLSEDQGSTWIKSHESDFNIIKICRDFTQDTTVDGEHIHQIDVNLLGNGITSGTSESPPHIHSVLNWIIQEEDSHFHLINSVLFAIDENQSLFRSNDSGANWIKISDIPDFLEIGDIYAFNNIFYISSSDGIWKYNNQWNKISDVVAYSFGHSFDFSKFYVGSANNLFECDGEKLVLIKSFEGTGKSLFANKKFNFYQSNTDSSIYFKFNKVPESDEFISWNDQVYWAENGHWDTNGKFDIFNNGIKIYSNYGDIDTRSEKIQYFDIISENGKISLEKETVLSNECKVGEDFITVSNSEGLYVDDYIFIGNCKTNALFQPEIDLSNLNLLPQTLSDPTIDLSKEETDELLSNAIKSLADDKSLIISDYSSRKKTLNEKFFCKITNVSGNKIYLNKSLDRDFTTNTKVYRLSSILSDSNMEIDIIKSKFKDVGVNTHKDIDNILSNIFNDMPIKMANSFNSNILQLIQAVKYAYPDISSEMINSKFYDMHYSNNVSDNNYIDNFIDSGLSERNSANLYDTEFNGKTAAKINYVFLGSGEFNNKVFVATNIGLFWTNYTESGEQNWWFSNEIDSECFCVSQYHNEKILVGTQNGLYSSEDLISWKLEENGIDAFPIKHIAYRWGNTGSKEKIVTDVNLLNIDANTGSIVGYNKFSGFTVNTSINLTATDNPTVDGFYVLTFVSPDQIQFTPKLPISDNLTESLIIINTDNWWNEFSNDSNSFSSSIKNPLLLSGINAIFQNTKSDLKIWQGCNLSNEKDWEAKQMLPLNKGNIVSIVNNLNETSSKLYSSTDSGLNWNEIFEIKQIVSVITNKEITSDGFLKLTIDDMNRYLKGELKGRPVEITLNKITYRSIVVWNEVSDNLNLIYLQDEGFLSSIKIKVDKITILAPTFNNVFEFNNKLVIGSNLGLLEDSSSIVSNTQLTGRLTGYYNSGTIVSVGAYGKIIKIYRTSQNQLCFTVKSYSQDVFLNQFKDGKIYINGFNDFFKIIENTSTKVQFEFDVTVDQNYDQSFEILSGQDVTVVSLITKIHINLNNNLIPKYFANGTAFINNSSYVDSDELTKTYNIIDNGTDWISINMPDLEFFNIISGNSVKLMTKNKEINLLIDYNVLVEDYQLNNREITWNIIRDQANPIKDAKIIYNKDNIINITLNEKDIINIKMGDSFSVTDCNLTQLDNFNIGLTNNNSDHYHDVELLKTYLHGEITSLIQIDNVVKIYFNNIDGFDNSLLSEYPELLNDEYCKFNTLENQFKIYSKKIKSIYPTYLEVYIGDSTDWNFSDSSNSIISAGWKIEVDARFHGKTTNIHYKYFNAINRKLISDLHLGETTVNVNSSDMTAGDIVEIKDNKNGTNLNEILEIIDSAHIKLLNKIDIECLISNFAAISVKKNNHTNNHTHLIRKGKAEKIRVEEFSNLGYNIYHKHYLTPYIENVQGICLKNEEIMICGNSSIIYSSQELNDWEEKININNCLEKDGLVENISFITLDYSGGIVAGVTNNKYSYLYSEIYTPINAEPITYL